MQLLGQRLEREVGRKPFPSTVGIVPDPLVEGVVPPRGAEALVIPLPPLVVSVAKKPWGRCCRRSGLKRGVGLRPANVLARPGGRRRLGFDPFATSLAFGLRTASLTCLAILLRLLAPPLCGFTF